MSLDCTNQEDTTISNNTFNTMFIYVNININEDHLLMI